MNGHVPASSIEGRSSVPKPETLSGNLGTFDIVFTVLAYNAPLTVVMGFLALIVSLGNGLGAPITFLIAGGLMLLLAVGFTTMSKHVPNAGAFYAYVTAGLGKELGFGSALMAILAYAFMMVGIYLYAGMIYSNLVMQIFNSAPYVWWAYSLALLAIVSMLGYLRITLSAKLLTIALVCEVVMVLCWQVAVVSAKGPVGMSPSWMTLDAVTSGSLGIGLLLGVTSFAGFEATAVFREEARNPSVTIPRATYSAVILLSMLFASSAYAYICGFGPEVALSRSSADPSTAALESIGLFLGNTGKQAVSFLLCSSIFACALALHNIVARYIYCLGIDGAIPRGLAAVHVRHGSPHRASMLVSIVMLVVLIALVIADIEPYAGYGALTGTGGYVLLILLVLTSLSVVTFFAGKSVTSSRWKTLYAPFLSFLALAVVGVLATINMDVLTGNLQAAVLLLLSIASTLIGGCLYARWLKAERPEIYQGIGRQKL